MTDPVDTDALRDLAANPMANGRRLLDIFDGLNAAAGEVDRLLSRVVELEAMVVATSNDRRRLRAVIESAPHGDLCKAANGWPLNECDCWKADVL